MTYKDFGANGLRIGCIISQNNSPLLDAVKANSYAFPSPFLSPLPPDSSDNRLFTYPPSISDHITCSLLTNNALTETYITINQRRLTSNYVFATSILNQHNIPYSPNVNAAFFLWIDLKSPFSKVATEEERSKQGIDLSKAIMARLMKEKVFIANGEEFAGEEPGWFRVVFSQPKAYVEEGLRRMMKAFGVKIA